MKKPWESKTNFVATVFPAAILGLAGMIPDFKEAICGAGAGAVIVAQAALTLVARNFRSDISVRRRERHLDLIGLADKK